MAACLITISGTSGLLRLDYKISSIPYSIETGVGTLYIEDTATDVTYTTLSGDLVASSGCLTITEIPLNCYSIFWEELIAHDYAIESIILGNETISISEVSFSNAGVYLANSINDLDDNRIKVIGYKKEYNYINDVQYVQYYYVFKVFGIDTPILKIRNADSTNYIYIYGILSGSCSLPSGYTPIEPCYSTITTTTTLAP